jgi:co-chaperonin GroES (HSP10)
MAGGIIVPERAKKETWEDEGLATGFGKRDGAGRRFKMKIKAGDCILCCQFSGDFADTKRGVGKRTLACPKAMESSIVRVAFM